MALYTITLTLTSNYGNFSGKRLFGDGYSGLEFDYRGLLRLYRTVKNYSMAEHYHIVLQQWNQIRDRTNSTEVEPLEFNTQMTLPELVQTVFEKVTWRKAFLLWMAWCWHHISWFLWKLIICFELEESVFTEVLQQGLPWKVVKVRFVFELQIYGDFYCCIMLNDWSV